MKSESTIKHTLRYKWKLLDSPGRSSIASSLMPAACTFKRVFLLVISLLLVGPFAGPRRRQCSPRFSLFFLSFSREFEYRFTLFSGKKEANLHLVFRYSQNAILLVAIFLCIYIYIYIWVIVFIYLYMYIYMQSLTRVYLQLFTSRFYISGKALSTVGFVGRYVRARRNIIPHVYRTRKS